jgi:hypothetical protein
VAERFDELVHVSVRLAAVAALVAPLPGARSVVAVALAGPDPFADQ